MGNEYVYPDARQGNVETLNRYKPKTIVTACPHCFNTIGNEYGQLGGHYEVVHHSTFLLALVGEGRLRPTRPQPTAKRRVTLTYHDSCYLARYNGVIAEPRDVLDAVPGIELREMEKQRHADVLLRRRWRPDVDGGEARHAHQRRADAPGARHRRRGGRHGLPVLPGDDARRPRRRARRPVGAQDVAEILAACRSQPPRSALSSCI